MKPGTGSPTDQTYLESIREHLRAIRRGRLVESPTTEAGWQARLQGVREGLRRSIGRTPSSPCDLAPDLLGTLHRDGYVIERLTFQSRPGLRVTANLYRPDPSNGPHAGVLCVHGHWAWARIDPNVQARCIGLAKLGYVVLAVDAFGAGERAIEPNPGTYHGGLNGASLWPIGVSLLGLQVYDNRRAVDYLISRPEIDPKRLAITGASGGGNQSLYAGALDERLAAVVPVCGVGTYESYLGTGCCVCELNAGGLTYATTGDLLAMMAPRALLVVNATQDVIQFSVAEAAKSIDYARPRYQGLGAVAKLRHLAIESGHAYNKVMREAMYGWFDRWLRDKGDGRPVTEPTITLEDPQALRCYPDGRSRPNTIVTIPQFALNEGRAQLAALPKPPDHPQRWEAHAEQIRSVFVGWLEGASNIQGRPGPPSKPRVSGDEGPERSIRNRANQELKGLWFAAGAATTTVLLFRHEGRAMANDPIVTALQASGRAVLSVDLRAIGSNQPPGGVVHGVTDHNEAEWGLWTGRPLLADWVQDALDWTDGLLQLVRPTSGKIEIVGVGPFGLVGLIAAGLRPGAISRVGLFNTLISFVGDDTTPWSKVPMGLMVPNLLETADIDHFAALVAPNRLTIAGAVEPSGSTVSHARMAHGVSFTRAVYKTLNADDRLTVIASSDTAAFGLAFANG